MVPHTLPFGYPAAASGRVPATRVRICGRPQHACL